MFRDYRLLLPIVCVGALGMCGGCVGLVAGWGRFWPYPSRTETCPLPHQIPKYPDGISLRFAMVHDVVHERFPRHGTAFYRERNRRVRQALDALAAQPGPA